MASGLARGGTIGRDYLHLGSDLVGSPASASEWKKGQGTRDAVLLAIFHSFILSSFAAVSNSSRCERGQM